MLTKSYIIRNNQYFLGDYVNSAEIPISYLPIWIGITLPLIFLICFVGGTIKTINNWINNRIEIKNHFEVFLLISLFTPILAAIIFNSTLYDSWRQFYFIYPFMVYFILIGFKYVHSIIEKKLHSKSIIVFLSIAVFSPSIFSIVSMHPNQYAFFNVLAGQDPMKNFDGDYWGLSYKQGLEYIAENDNRKKIKISVRNSPGRHNIKILEKKDRDRFEYVENIKESNYYLTNYRWKMKENYHLAKIDSHPVGKEYFSVNIGQMKILGVYKINLND